MTPSEFLAAIPNLLALGPGDKLVGTWRWEAQPDGTLRPTSLELVRFPADKPPTPATLVAVPPAEAAP